MKKTPLVIGGALGALLFTIGWLIFVVGTWNSYGLTWFWWSLAGVVLTAVGGGLTIVMGFINGLIRKF